MPPTIATVLPAKGHTGGATLIEITGSGFVLPPGPGNALPAPAPVARMRVSFGGVVADGVEVTDAGTLYCFTPVHDAGVVDVSVQELAELPAEVRSAAGPFALAGGETLELVVLEGDVQSVTIGVGEITPGAATPAQVAAALNRFVGVQVTVVDGRVRIRTDARGTGAKLRVTGGTARAPLGLDTDVHAGSTELELVGQPATAVGAFEFVRPDLTVKMPVTLVLEQLQVELRRQVLDNVHFATHSDFDADTGDLLNTAILAKVPAIVLADVQLPDSRLPVGKIPAEDDGDGEDGEDGVSLVREPEDLVDALVTLLVVTDSPIELFNLTAIMRRWARKNAKLLVGETEYPMTYEVGSNIQVSAQRGGENLHTSTSLVTILGIPIGDLPIAYTGPMPAGVKQGARYESVTQLGWPQTAAPNVGFDPKG
jgi:hypothetical protein